jgi:hypothetical protein
MPETKRPAYRVRHLLFAVAWLGINVAMVRPFLASDRGHTLPFAGLHAFAVTFVIVNVIVFALVVLMLYDER